MQASLICFGILIFVSLIDIATSTGGHAHNPLGSFTGTFLLIVFTCPIVLIGLCLKKPIKKKPSYKIFIDGDCVHTKWFRGITEWSEREGDLYLTKLRDAVKETVSKEVWELLTKENLRSEDPEYISYVEEIKKDLIGRYSIEKEHVKVGLYHGDSLVISFPSEEIEKYPYYFKGVQLKPLKKKK
ncbi:MAG: hypothetical protein NE328_05455 [Lentisphaeraceae bacterium]|nr:hypothetical protein [Lentisphaeraceae bacterium]